MGEIIINFRKHFERKPSEDHKKFDELSTNGSLDAYRKGQELEHSITYIFTSPSNIAEQSGVLLGKGNYEKHKAKRAGLASNVKLSEYNVGSATLERGFAAAQNGGTPQEKLDLLVDSILNDRSILPGEDTALSAGTRLIHFIGDVYLALSEFAPDFRQIGAKTYVEAITHSPVIEAGLIGMLNSGRADKVEYKVTYIGGAFASGRYAVVTMNTDLHEFGRNLTMRANCATHVLSLDPEHTRAIRRNAGLH